MSASCKLYISTLLEGLACLAADLCSGSRARRSLDMQTAQPSRSGVVRVCGDGRGEAPLIRSGWELREGGKSIDFVDRRGVELEEQVGDILVGPAISGDHVDHVEQFGREGVACPLEAGGPERRSNAPGPRPPPSPTATGPASRATAVVRLPGVRDRQCWPRATCWNWAMKSTGLKLCSSALRDYHRRSQRVARTRHLVCDLDRGCRCSPAMVVAALGEGGDWCLRRPTHGPAFCAESAVGCRRVLVAQIRSIWAGQAVP